MIPMISTATEVILASEGNAASALAGLSVICRGELDDVGDSASSALSCSCGFVIRSSEASVGGDVFDLRRRFAMPIALER